MMCDERVVSLQKTLQYLSMKVPLIILQRVEERFPILRECLNCIVIEKSEPCSSTEKLMMSDDGNQVVDIKVEEVTDVKSEENPDPTAFTRIKNEPMNCMDMLRDEHGSCIEMCPTSCGKGDQFLFVNVEEFTDMEVEEDPESSSPVIKTEPASTVNELLCAHSGMHPYCCDVCNKAFSKKCHLLTHKRVHSGERPFSCDICNKAFSQVSTLITHKRIHSGERPFSCDVCNKTFGRQSHMMSHKRVHSGERPFSCDVCNKAFSHRNSLMRHMRIHSGERPFCCDVCSKAFGDVGNLMTHRRIHTGERPFSCAVCKKAFGQQSSLIRHKRIHSGQWSFSYDVIE